MIIKTHWDTVLPYLQTSGQRRLLQLTDTVEFDFTKKRSRKALGPLNYAFRRGTIVHNSLIINDKLVPMSLLRQSHHIRNDEDFGQAAERQSIPFQEKKSYRWYEHFMEGQSFCQQNPDIELVYVADREADIMELYLARSCEQMHFVVRSQHDRKLEGKSDNLYRLLSEQAVQGTYKVTAYDPKKQPTIFEYCQVLGQIGGFFPSKRQPIPGLKILGRAVEQLHHWVDAYLLFCQRTE